MLPALCDIVLPQFAGHDGASVLGPTVFIGKAAIQAAMGLLHKAAAQGGGFSAHLGLQFAFGLDVSQRQPLAPGHVGSGRKILMQGALDMGRMRALPSMPFE